MSTEATSAAPAATPAAAPAVTPAAAVPTPVAPSPASTTQTGTPAPAQASAQTPAADESVIAQAPPPPPADVEFKVPEGVKADDTLLTAFKPLAKELGLKGDGAQKLVDLYASTMKSNAAAADAAFKQQQTAWRDSVKSDKEIGGQNFEATRVEVGRFFNAVDKDGSIRSAIHQMGLANHPALVRLAVRAAKTLREDGGAGSVASGSGPASNEDVLRFRYPTMFKD